MADLNRTTAERFAERKRHVRFWNVMRHLVGFWMRRKVNLSLDDLSDIPAPYLLLCNHTTNLDPIFVGLAMGRQAYFVATENVLHKGFVSYITLTVVTMAVVTFCQMFRFLFFTDTNAAAVWRTGLIQLLWSLPWAVPVYFPCKSIADRNPL